MSLETKIINLLRKTKLGKHPTIGKFLADLVIYPTIGILPGKIQESLAKKSEIPETRFCWFSLGVATSLAAIRIGTAGVCLYLSECGADNKIVQYLEETTGTGMMLWGHII